MKYFIFTFVIFLAFSNVACYRDRTPEEVDEIVSKSDALKRVNQLCMDMPKPDGFNFIKKGLGGNSVTAATVFYYLSDKEPDEIREFYKKWAKENGWQLSEGNQFTKGKQTIVLEFAPINDSNVELTCKEPR